MKTKFVLSSLVAILMVLEVSAQRAEYDDMYFNGKDRERNKAVLAEENVPQAKNKKLKEKEKQTAEAEEEDNSNPTDSYSARHVNPEYVSRENSEQASEDETNYYVEGYTPASNNQFSYNNSYYNNSNWARSSYYANSGWNSPYYGGCGYCNSGWGMYSPYGYNDPFMMPGYGYGYPSYGWRTGWSVSFMFGNYYNPWGYGMYNPYNNFYNPYYAGGYGYPNYYYSGGNNYEGSRPNYAKRPSRHSAVVTPTDRTVSRTRPSVTGNSSAKNDNSSTVNTRRTRTREPQPDYYVRPARRTSLFDNSSTSPSNTRPFNNGNSRDFFSNPTTTQPSRSREYSSPSQNSSPSYSPPSSSPSRSSGGSSGGGGGSSPRPRGRN